MEDLSSKFPDAIKNYKYHSVMKIYKDWGIFELLKLN
jgi:hypothetical protein